MALSIASSSIRRTTSNHHLSSIDILLKLTRIGFAQGRGGLRSIYISSITDHRLEAPSTFPSPSILDIGTYKEEFEIGSHCITFEAAGGIKESPFGTISSVRTTSTFNYKKCGSPFYRNIIIGDEVESTTVKSTVSSAPLCFISESFPLNVDYHRRQFSSKKILGTQFPRRGEAADFVSRPIRPLFPPGFNHEVKVNATVLGYDEQQDTDIMAANATSAALMLSDIPWAGPIGVVRVGMIFGDFVINPAMDELKLSDLDLVYTCTQDKTLMVDVQAQEVSERDLKAALQLAHSEAVKYLDPQRRLASKAGRRKDYKLAMLAPRTDKKVESLAEAPIGAVLTDPKLRKSEEHEKALGKITRDVKRILEEEEYDVDCIDGLPKMIA
ncbi:hypothetical protein MKW98_020184 [Papaver atlanticum]|uniref:Uncharacterized protein n=1 Tax=Papaver atlanticum TaxID=357466 RepID=A0AAD4SB54_9MAGN|nr:hypothetical protein MKW98_020184 [Papaver atlanticum]